MRFPSLLSLLLTSWCTYEATAETAPIGALAELTGQFSRVGADCQRGYEVATDFGSSADHVLFGDNRSDPKAGISEFHRMVETEGAKVIVTSRSPVGLALNPLSVQRRVPLVGIVGHPRFLSENPFAVRMFPSASVEARVLAEEINARDYQRIAIVSVEDDYFLGLAAELKTRLEETKAVFSRTILPTEHDYSSLLVPLRSSNPDLIFINVAPAQLVQFVHRIRESRIDAALVSNFGAGLPDIRRGLGKDGDGIVFAELDFEQPKFMEAVKKRSGVAESSPLGYACNVALLYAMKLRETAASSKKAPEDVISSITEIATLDGPVAIVDREAQFEVSLKELRGGAAVKRPA